MIFSGASVRSARQRSGVLQQVVCNEKIGESVCKIMGWSGCRVGQDDVVWKRPDIFNDVDIGKAGRDELAEPVEAWVN